MSKEEKITVDNVEFWQKYYDSNDTPWDLGLCAPPLQALVESKRFAPGKIAVLGCGRGHEALMLGKNHFAVTAIDFAPSAVEATGQQFIEAGIPVRLIQRDIFELQDVYGQFDYLLEHTCFCAIHPKRRQEYVGVASGLLKPGGLVLGLFFVFDRMGGPPYGVTRERLHELFEPQFRFVSEEQPAQSVEKRANEELLVVMEKSR